MSRKVFKKEGSDYPHYQIMGSGSGYEDLDNRPLEAKHRVYVPKSKALIRIGTVEQLSHGTLKCFMRGKLAVVGLYQNKKPVGYELLYKPTSGEIENGIPEWKFDMQNMSVFGTDWDYQDTSIFF